MPANKTRHTLARQWELLKLLPTRGPGKTAKELAEALNDAGFQVSKRQVERDLGELYDAFTLDCNNASPPYGWRLPPKATIDIPGLTLAEALSLRLVEDTLRTLLPPALLDALESRFQQAQRKLEALAEGNASARWINKVRTVPPALPLLPPELDRDVLETVQEALLADRQLEVEYRKFDAEEPSKLTLHPLGLVQRGPATYLVATAFDYQDIRLYALHRFQAATKTEKPVKPPEGFNLDAYIGGGALQFGNGNTLRLEAALSDGLAQILRETPLSPDQDIVEEGGVITVAATVADTWQLRWWILSQGDGIEVTAPGSLREEIALSLKQAAEQYAG